MHVLGGIDYIPQKYGITSAEALSNPYHSYMKNLNNDFINDVPFLKNIVLDTHFQQRDRMGRFITFQARSMKDFSLAEIKGIACDEQTALYIEPNGIAKVYSLNNSSVYFTKSNSIPERCTSRYSLYWYNTKNAITTYSIKGDTTGSKTFNLNTWSSTDSTPYPIWVNYGTLNPSNPY